MNMRVLDRELNVEERQLNGMVDTEKDKQTRYGP